MKTVLNFMDMVAGMVVMNQEATKEIFSIDITLDEITIYVWEDGRGFGESLANAHKLEVNLRDLRSVTAAYHWLDMLVNP